MKCPFCQADDTKVVDSRHQANGQSVRRRRLCDQCSKRFTTYEKVEWTLPMVLKNDGRREEFSRDKIFAGIQKASQKRNVPVEQIERIVESVERAFVERNASEISSEEVGHLVMEQLKYLDPVAYVRFASVYINFKNIEEFIRDLRNMQQSKTPPNQSSV